VASESFTRKSLEEIQEERRRREAAETAAREAWDRARAVSEAAAAADSERVGLQALLGKQREEIEQLEVRIRVCPERVGV
jgi:hypothetical protein